ncbi:hypothetical protein ACO0QE_002291 [Hanseniaspora vineae]
MSDNGSIVSNSRSKSSTSDSYNNISDLSIPLGSIPKKYLQTDIQRKIGIDIGGTLAKLVYFDDVRQCLDFKFIGTAEIDEFIELIQQIISEKIEYRRSQEPAGENTQPDDNSTSGIEIHATGGGAYKFNDTLVQRFGQDTIKRKDEMESAINGLTFLINYNDYLNEKIDIQEKEIFTYNNNDGKRYVEMQKITRGSPSAKENTIMLVNIGSGVSMIKINRDTNEFKRVGGSSLGGGTLWGLLSLMTGAETYDEMLELASQGDNSKVDMLVGDIYGSSYDNIGLKASHIASSMGKAFPKKNQDPDFNKSDICKSMLYAVSNNIGQISYLQSKIHHVDTIFFGGSYIRGHLMTMNTLNYAINFWSQGSSNAYFLEHEAYLGALGSIFI